MKDSIPDSITISLRNLFLFGIVQTFVFYAIVWSFHSTITSSVRVNHDKIEEVAQGITAINVSRWRDTDKTRWTDELQRLNPELKLPE